MGPEGRLCKYGAIMAVALFAVCEAISNKVKKLFGLGVYENRLVLCSQQYELVKQLLE